MERNISIKRRIFAFLAVLLCLCAVVGISAGIGRLIWEQGREVAVSVDTKGKLYTETVTVTVSNVLGMDLLIDERDGCCAMLQYAGEDGWTDVSAIRFAEADASTVSAKYGGMFVHLAPGGELTYHMDEEQLQDLPSGQYRIALRYISEDAYGAYLRDISAQLEEAWAESETGSGDLSEQPSEDDITSAEDSSDSNAEESVSQGNVLLPTMQPKTEVLYKTFRLVGRDQDVSGQSAEDTYGDLQVSVDLK